MASILDWLELHSMDDEEGTQVDCYSSVVYALELVVQSEYHMVSGYCEVR